MSDKKKRWDIKGHLSNHIRLVFRNDDTLQEIGSYRLNFLGLYTLISMIAVILFTLFWLLTAYTPLKKFMPGYNDVYKHPEFIELYNRINDLEKSFEAQELYTESVRKLLMAEHDDTTDTNILTKVPDTETDLEISLKNENDLTTVESPPSSEGDKSWGFAQMRRAETGSGVRALQQLYLIAPLKGMVSRSFDPIQRHYGIDVVAPANTAVRAVLDGYVISSDWTLETGNTIGIQHENNIVSFYKHNSINLKKTGTYVRSGEAVAIIGNTGVLSDGPHLHFELWVDGKPVNPADYIQF
jgi:murein DD-endopeptidase MepM/ murein hydrolase activator NlpD